MELDGYLEQLKTREAIDHKAVVRLRVWNIVGKRLHYGRMRKMIDELGAEGANLAVDEALKSKDFIATFIRIWKDERIK